MKCARDGGVLPDSGFPRYDGMAIEERAKTIRSRCKTRASHTTHKHSFTGGRLGVIPSKRAFSGQIEFDEGSSGTRAVVEVVVLATVVEVVVHERHGSSHSRGDGSGSSRTRLWR